MCATFNCICKVKKSSLLFYDNQKAKAEDVFDLILCDEKAVGKALGKVMCHICG